MLCSLYFRNDSTLRCADKIKANAASDNSGAIWCVENEPWRTRYGRLCHLAGYGDCERKFCLHRKMSDLEADVEKIELEVQQDEVLAEKAEDEQEDPWKEDPSALSPFGGWL